MFPEDPHFPSYEEAVRHVTNLFERNAETPWKVRQVTLEGVRTTRRAVFEQYVRPILNETGTLAEVVLRLQVAADRLRKLDIFDDISIDLDTPSTAAKSAAMGAGEPDLLDVTLRIKEKPRVRAETGTQMGNNEGNMHASLSVRNVFGSAESLATNIAFGTKTHSSFEGVFTKPSTADPRRQLHLAAHQVHRSNQATSSHDELARALALRLVFPSPLGNHQLAYTLGWRQILDVADSASLSVRHEAGHSLKSAVSHSLVRDTRDSGSLPTRGTLLRVESELAGVAQVGDVRHVKNEVEAQWNLALGRGFSLSNTFRLGALVPLDGDVPRIADRIFLGGPTSVRGFTHHGIGPKDGTDALGGTVAYQAGVSLFAPVPGLADKDWLRMHAFVNAGSAGQAVPWTRDAVEALARVPPSVSAGFGLALRHPVCRLELNWAVPLVVHRGDAFKRGVSFGLGINFL
ncbi:hypothetical protein H9P43_006356 [Blastocladiella emersonii ATCC 22665]|nr:hypothetical protein H9P43_006356 [Blastocladiella emersonii ATCC 22665]